jgi:hypothetical protein
MPSSGNEGSDSLASSPNPANSPIASNCSNNHSSPPLSNPNPNPNPNSNPIAPGKASPSQLIDELISHFVEPRTTQPTFLIDHPILLSPLARKHREKVQRPLFIYLLC